MKAPLTDLIVVTERIKHALIHVYNKMNAVRRSASNLPKLLSVLDILTPNERRFLQFVLANLSTKTIKDLGCYFYIIEFIGRTQSLRDLSFETNSPRNILDHWHVLEASASLSTHKDVYMPQYKDDQMFMSNISYYLFGMYAPPMACTAYQVKEKNVERLALDVKRFFEVFSSPPLLNNTTGGRFDLSPVCPHLFDLVALLKGSVSGACSHVYETPMGRYHILVDCYSAVLQRGTLRAPFIISMVDSVEYPSRMLRAAGWLTIPSPSILIVPIVDVFTEIVVDLLAEPGAAGWMRPFSLPSSLWAVVRYVLLHQYGRICLGDSHLAPSLWNTMFKSELTKLELELVMEFNKLESEHSGCSCYLCVS